MIKFVVVPLFSICMATSARSLLRTFHLSPSPPAAFQNFLTSSVRNQLHHNMASLSYCGDIKNDANSGSGSSITNALPAIRRSIVHRTMGNKHGPITRLVSPGDLGEVIKPFIFLDLFQPPSVAGFKGFGWHPHSGICTVTVLLRGRSWYEETIHPRGELEQGGVEFFRAAKGAWHTGGPLGAGPVKGFQLWISLPEAQELNQPDSFYLKPEDVPVHGPARIILGSYQGLTSTIPATATINYLDVNLSMGQRWEYLTPADHNVAFVSVSAGTLKTGENEMIQEGELVVFNEGGGNLVFEATSDVQFMLGTAVKHPHELHCGSYSVHTSRQALKTGEAEIQRIGTELKAQRKI